MLNNKLSEAILMLLKHLDITYLIVDNNPSLKFEGTMPVDYDEVIKPLLLTKVDVCRDGKLEIRPSEYFCTFCGLKLQIIRNESKQCYFGCRNTGCEKQPIFSSGASDSDAIAAYLKKFKY